MNNKYEEALAKAKKWYDANTNEGYRKIFEDIFPELSESEDEKIRKEIIQSIKDNMCVIHKEKCLDWLEKQTKQLSVDWNEKRKGLDDLETYILSLDPNRSLAAIKVDAKNIRFLVNKDKTNKIYTQKFKIGDTVCRQGWADHTIEKIYNDGNFEPVYICKNEEGLESHISFSEQDEWKLKDENKYDKGYNDGFSASEYNRKMIEEDIRHNDNIICGIV